MNVDNHIHQHDMSLWHVLHVRPRCEKKMAAYCASSMFSHYLPLKTEHKIYQRQKVEIQKPLFPGYVFVNFSPEQRILVLKSQLIVRILEVNNQALLLDELSQIQKALEVNPNLGACSAVECGCRIRITTGPFQGVEGIVTTFKGKTRVVLNVDIIGQGVPVEVSLDMLERL